MQNKNQRKNWREGEKNWREKKLKGKKLKGKRLQGKRLQGKRLQGKNLQGKRLQGKKLQGKRLQGKKWQGKKIEGEKNWNLKTDKARKKLPLAEAIIWWYRVISSKVDFFVVSYPITNTSECLQYLQKLIITFFSKEIIIL